ncbi:MAG: tetratricopeptide repeat protein [Anaerolineales bacterium]|nr:tetratricopeptide repeat protein [Anaerolineales bacterium]
MNNHEFWNELGNLYFMQGAYQPAIHAYLRSIESEIRFGRSYSNLAMAFVQIGKYDEAIKLYRRSITLLPDEKEKAITWNRLGILYRQVKDYNSALEAYQQADILDPQQESDGLSQSGRGSTMPLTVSKPDLDIESLISSDAGMDDPEKTDVFQINAELEIAEEQSNISWFGSGFLPSDLEEPLVMETVHETMAGIHSDWNPAAAEETAFVDSPLLVDLGLENAALEDLPLIIPIDLELVPPDDLDEETLETSTQAEYGESQPIWFEMSSDETEAAQSETQYGHEEIRQAVDAPVASETETGSTAAYPVMELSEAESNSIELDIVKQKQAAQDHPRNYAVWERLGDSYKAAGHYEDALLAYQNAVTVNPNKPSSFYRLGLVQAVERNDAEAVMAFQKVLELVPDHAQAHASLASQYLRMGMERLARPHIEKALNANLEDETEYNRACLEAICGNNERALELLEIALQTKQTFINWAGKDPDLDSLRGDHRFQNLLTAYAASA